MRATSAQPPDPPEARRGGPLRGVPAAPVPASGAESGSNDPSATVALDILRSLADQEVERAETARTRSRQGFALAVGVFAVVQTVAYGQFVTKLAIQGHRTGTLINHTAWAAVGLAASALFLLAAELPLGSHNVRPDRVRDLASSPSAMTLSELTQDYYLIVESHREANRKRFVLVLFSQLAALATVGLVIWELIVALHASL